MSNIGSRGEAGRGNDTRTAGSCAGLGRRAICGGVQAAGMAAMALFVAASVPLCGAFSPMHLRHGVLHRSAQGSAASPHRPCEHGRVAGVALAAKQQSAADEAAQAAINIYSGASTEDEDQAAVKRLEFDMVMVRSHLNLDQHIRHKSSQMSALMAAVVMGRCDMATGLMMIGANVEERDLDGKTPLMVAASRGDIKMLEVLLQHGASALARDQHGDTALLLAAREGQVEAVEMLRKPAVSLHHLYSPPHFKAFLWMSGTETSISSQRADQVRAAVSELKAIPLAKMNLDMVSINAAIRLDSILDDYRPAQKEADKVSLDGADGQAAVTVTAAAT